MAGQRQVIYAVILFTRLSALSLTATLPLLGAATVARRVPAPLIAGLIGVAVAFHIFAYVLNDIVDLPIDRSEPRRVDFPLVRGSIQPWQAWLVVLTQVPLALALTAGLGGRPAAAGILLVGFVLMAVYNLCGKRAFFPPLTDAGQGLAWATLVLYGALIVDGHVLALTTIVALFVSVFIMLVNGVHGSLRDLTNDLRCGVRSTAILLGARGLDEGGWYLPLALKGYAWTLQGLLAVLLLMILVRNDLQYPPAILALVAALTLILFLASCGLLRVAMTADGRPDRQASGVLHVVLCFSSLLAVLLPSLDLGMQVVLLAAFVLPLLSNSWLYNAVAWIWRRGRGDHP